MENNLYQKIQPWDEGIKIHSIERGDGLRIFVIFVPKSDNPPHMARLRYYMRLNFQTKPIGHDQIASYFKENYLQKYDMISTIYEPIYNELTGYFSQNLIQKWGISTFYQIKKR